MKNLLKAGVLIVLCFTSQRGAAADAQGDMMRALVHKYGESAVSLQLVLKTAVGGGGQQARMEAGGIVIDPGGLIATTNTAIDPASMYASLMGEEYARSMTTSVVSLKILLATGEEIPARVVLRDKDRNLAIIRPLQRLKKPLTSVDFKGAHTARLGDPLYLLGRLGKAGSRQPQMTVQRVTGLVDKPRRFYVMDMSAYTYLGNVAFNENGQPLGLVSIRMVSGGRSMMGADSFLAVVIPAADIWEVALQAPQAKDVREPRPATTPAKPKPAKTPPRKAPAAPGKKAR